MSEALIWQTLFDFARTRLANKVQRTLHIHDPLPCLPLALTDAHQSAALECLPQMQADDRTGQTRHRRTTA